MKCDQCGARFSVAPPEKRWPNGERNIERGMRLTGLCETHYLDLAKWQEYPWPSLTKDERFDYIALHGKPLGEVT